MKRSGSSQVELGIRGPPCRKVPQLQGKTKSNAATVEKNKISGSLFEIEPPQPIPVSIQSDNPFKYLLALGGSQPGEVAFAFYVQDSWERQKSVGQYDDEDKFLKQCKKWWAGRPSLLTILFTNLCLRGANTLQKRVLD